MDIATELLKQVTLANVNLQKRDEITQTDNLDSDSIVYYIGSLQNDINDLRNFSLQLLANSALADTRSEFNTFKNETKKDLEDFKIFTSKEIDEIKTLAKEILNNGRKGSGKGDNNLSRELKDLSKAMEKSNSKISSSLDEEYLEEIVETYQELVKKIDDSSVKNDIQEIKDEIANLSSINNESLSSNENIEITSSGNNSSIDNSAGLSELKYYIVELMKDQNEIRQIVKDLREILEKDSEN